MAYLLKFKNYQIFQKREDVNMGSTLILWYPRKTTEDAGTFLCVKATCSKENKRLLA